LKNYKQSQFKLSQTSNRKGKEKNCEHTICITPAWRKMGIKNRKLWFGVCPWKPPKPHMSSNEVVQVGVVVVVSFKQGNGSDDTSGTDFMPDNRAVANKSSK
jgi:hypothetical protein